MNGDLGRMGKDTVVGYFDLQCWYLLELTEESKETGEVILNLKKSR
jgi:hypothetical protein